MKMQKLLAIVIAITVMTSASMVFAQETYNTASSQVGTMIERSVLSTTGEIKEIREGRIQVVGTGAYQEIVLNIQDSTHILSGIDGTPIPLTNLKQGEAITAYYSPKVTRSLPPQGNAVALIVGKPDKGNAGMYLKVAKIMQQGENAGIKVLCTNGDRLVTLSPDIVNTSAIKAGSELIVWYDVMTMSMPGQAGATKAVLLPVKADIRVHTLAGVVVVNGKELTLHEHDSIRTDGDTVMLPLRTIAESLGYKVVWYEETQTAELQKGASTMMATIGSNSYGKLKMAVRLNHAPELVNGKMLVPVEFFTDLMKLKVEIDNSHV